MARTRPPTNQEHDAYEALVRPYFARMQPLLCGGRVREGQRERFLELSRELEAKRREAGFVLGHGGLRVEVRVRP